MSTRPGEQMIHIAVRFGSTLVPISGQARLNLQLSGGSTISDAIQQTAFLHPDLAEGLRSALPILDGEHADRRKTLQNGDEIALVMPVAGG